LRPQETCPSGRGRGQRRIPKSIGIAAAGLLSIFSLRS